MCIKKKREDRLKLRNEGEGNEMGRERAGP